MSLDINRIRGQFPALDRPSVFFDNPGGTQIAKPALDRMNDYLINSNANRSGAFSTSYESDAILEEARQAVADFFLRFGFFGFLFFLPDGMGMCPKGIPRR